MCPTSYSEEKSGEALYLKYAVYSDSIHGEAQIAQRFNPNRNETCGLPLAAFTEARQRSSRPCFALLPFGPLYKACFKYNATPIFSWEYTFTPSERDRDRYILWREEERGIGYVGDYEVFMLLSRNGVDGRECSVTCHVHKTKKWEEYPRKKHIFHFACIFKAVPSTHLAARTEIGGVGDRVCAFVGALHVL